MNAIEILKEARRAGNVVNMNELSVRPSVSHVCRCVLCGYPGSIQTLIGPVCSDCYNADDSIQEEGLYV